MLTDVPLPEHGPVIAIIIGQCYGFLTGKSALTDTASLIPSQTVIPRQPGSMIEFWPWRTLTWLLVVVVLGSGRGSNNTIFGSHSRREVMGPFHNSA